MRKTLIIGLSLSLVVFLIGCGHKIENPLNLTIDDFSYINQDNETVRLDDLKEKVWIANFVFTNCSTVCIPMMDNMAYLQDTFKESDVNVEFISFSVDPENDTPDLLKQFGMKHEADFSNWSLLTGYSQATIEQFAMDSFKTFAKKPANDSQVIHGISLFLVDQHGVVQREYNGLDAPADVIMKDVNYLLSKES